MLEPDRASFSLEPFLFADGELVTWADAEVSQSLAQRLPADPVVALALARSRAHHDRLRQRRRRRARARASATGVENTGRAPQRVRLFVALRPFQVTPPWQAFQGIGGTSPIRELAWSDGAVAGERPQARGPARSAQRLRRRGLRAGRRPAPPRARRAAAAHAGARRFAHASGALCLGPRAGAGRCARGGGRGALRRAGARRARRRRAARVRARGPAGGGRARLGGAARQGPRSASAAAPIAWTRCARRRRTSS